MKEFSEWPTIPQLYIKKEFVGGCDIVKEMYENGELKKILEKKRIIVEVENRIRSIASASNLQVIGSYNPSKNKCTVEEFYDGAQPKDICMRRVMNELNGIDSKWAELSIEMGSDHFYNILLFFPNNN